MQNDKKYYLCDEVTGQIKYKASKLLNNKIEENQRFVLHFDVDLNSHYFNSESNSIEERKTFPAGSWVGGEYVVSLPEKTMLLWQGERYTVNDGTAELMVDQPGQHQVILIHPHYYTETRYIENPEAD